MLGTARGRFPHFKLLCPSFYADILQCADGVFGITAGRFERELLAFPAVACPSALYLVGSELVLKLKINDLSWLLVATRPRSEFVARQHLERQDFQVCLPLITLNKRRQGRWQQLAEPMFPGYVFVGVKLGVQDIASIRSTQGCRQVVRFGGQLVPIPNDSVEKLFSYDRTPKVSSQNFRKGQAIRVEQGAFTGLEAAYERAAGADRVEVLLNFLGQLRLVGVPLSAIGTVS